MSVIETQGVGQKEGSTGDISPGEAEWRAEFPGIIPAVFVGAGKGFRSFPHGRSLELAVLRIVRGGGASET